jgi:FkbM family methyltransferase
VTKPFGELAPTPFQDRVRRLGARLPANGFGRKAASILLGAAGGRARRAYDVAVFGSQRARLHPYDNICEKRVFLTPQLWDPDERAFLGDVVSTFDGRTFHFVDVGANVGLYTLCARAAALRWGASFRSVCVEADPEMASRMRFNVAASQADGEVAIFECAASEAEATLRFHVDRRSRGLSRIDPGGEFEVRARPLLALLREARVDRVDAMKIDIEGHETPVVRAFLKDAPASLRPALAILEISHAGDDHGAEAAFLAAGYAVRFRTRRNAILVRADQRPA